MLPDAATLAVFFAASLALYITPGPDMMYIASRSLGQGRAAGIISAFGTCTGLLLHTLGAALGLTVLLTVWPLAYQIVKWLGVGYLIYLGIRALRSREQASPIAPDGARATHWWRLYGQGALVNLLNPKIALFFLAFLPQFADAEGGNFAARAMILGVLFTAGGLAWTLFLAWIFGNAGDWLARRPAVWKWQRRLTGSTLIALAAHLALSERR